MKPTDKSEQRVTFNALWAGYPSGKPYKDKDGNVPAGYDNQCAIKVSVALHAAGVNMLGFKGAKVSIGGKPAALRAEELADWLKKERLPGVFPIPVTLTGEKWQDLAKGRKGIIGRFQV